MKNIITLKNVDFSFEKTKVLENVNLTIQQGDFINFFGPNGGGKTTLIKLILGLLTPDSGTIEIFDKPPKEMSSKIGYIPQNPFINKDFPITVLEAVLLGSLSKSSWFFSYPKDLKETAQHLLEEVGLIDIQNKSFSSLSGGELQKALIAKALICDPEILILDEPTAHIDIYTEQKIFDLILKYRGKKTILMVTHNLELIIKEIKSAFLINKKVTPKLPKEICEHFALGLYHGPISKGSKND
jgi:zinc transport system ATP-binding protein